MTTVLESLNSALHQVLASDERVILLGEDILDPYGGAFKVTRGISSAFPDRTITTPVSEAGILGIATGMALRGLRPVVESVRRALAADRIGGSCDPLPAVRQARRGRAVLRAYRSHVQPSDPSAPPLPVGR